MNGGNNIFTLVIVVDNTDAIAFVCNVKEKQVLILTLFCKLRLICDFTKLTLINHIVVGMFQTM